MANTVPIIVTIVLILLILVFLLIDAFLGLFVFARYQPPKLAKAFQPVTGMVSKAS